MTQLRLGLPCPALAWPGLAWKGPLASESAGSLLSFLSIFLPFSLALLLNFVYLFSQEPHSQQICLKPGKRILLWSKSHPRAKPVGPKRQSNCCCSPCCCCSGCCYTQIARGNWQPLKESMQVASCCCWLGLPVGCAGQDWSQVNAKLRVCGSIWCN